MAAGNKNLNSAKTARKDEFYTQLTDIEKEMRYYRKHFKDKTVLCNCDDPFESNFFKYFVLNFNRLGLKKLIATCYTGSPIANKQLSMWDFKADDALVRGYRNSLAVGYQSHPKVSRIEERIAEIDREMDSRNNIRSRVRSADFQTRQNELAAERDMLQSDLEMMKDNRIEMTEELLSLIHSVGGSFDFEDTFQKITETVTIHDRSVFTVRFLCGLEVYYDGR